MKIFRFLRGHVVNLLIALLLLMVQAYSELTLPTVMSEIVDVGISRGGIESAVPERILEDDLHDIQLFLDTQAARTLESLYGETDDKGVRAFAGTASDREELSARIAPAEMALLALERGLPASSIDAMGEGLPGPLRTALKGAGDTVDIDDLDRIAAKLEPGSLAWVSSAIEDKMGSEGPSVMEGQAVAYVRGAYERAGVNLDQMQTAYLYREGTKMLGYALLGAVCAVAAAFNASRTAAVIARDLRHDVYGRVLSFSPAEMGKFSEASLITRATNDIQQIQMVLVMCMRMVLFAPCMGVGAVVKVIGYGSTGLQWIIVVGLAVISIIIGVLMGLTMPRFRRMQELVDTNNLIAREILTGIMPIRAFGRTGAEEARYDEANRALMGTYIFTNRAMSFMMPMLMLAMNLISIAIVWFGGQGVDAGVMQVGDLMAYMNYTMQVIMSFMIITMIAVMLPRADIASGRVLDVLATRSSIVDPEGGEAASEGSAPAAHRGLLAFNDVTFTYPGADAPTLEHIDFSVAPGQVLGIIGSTGCGKSTLVQLIPRLYDVTDGSVTVDGVDVREMGLRELRSLVGYVPQKSTLFSGTISDNIAFGDPDMGEERVEWASRIAQAHEFVTAKPEGYESPVAQGGSNVSGGQRQRVAIARGLAIQPKILVFDDSFSALDYKTDAALRQSLREQVSQAATVIVAQRIATIMHADQILVVDDGRVVGRGTHEELLATCEEYREIAVSQMSASELGLKGGEV